jgi:hypothetical protein
VLGVVAANVGAFEDLEVCCLEGLSHLLSDEQGEVVDLVFEKGCELAHPEGPMLERHLGVCGERFGRESNFLARGFVGEGLEAA